MPVIRKYASVDCEDCGENRRICAVCGEGPLDKGFCSRPDYEAEFFCGPCGELVDDVTYTDDNGIEYPGLTLGQYYELEHDEHDIYDPHSDYWGDGESTGYYEWYREGANWNCVCLAGRTERTLIVRE